MQYSREHFALTLRRTGFPEAPGRPCGFFLDRLSHSCESPGDPGEPTASVEADVSWLLSLTRPR